MSCARPCLLLVFADILMESSGAMLPTSLLWYHTHIWMEGMGEVDGIRGICNWVASHLQLGPIDVAPHVDWAAADGAAAVLKQFVHRRQHCRLTCLHVEDHLQRGTHPTSRSWNKPLGECLWSNYMP